MTGALVVATSVGSHVRAWLSASTALIALLAAALAAYQYFRDQRLGSWLRLEQQFSQHLGTLSDYSERGNLASANVVWAIENLTELVKLAPDPAAYRSRVTEVITTGMLDDANFDDARHVRLDRMCVERWPDYSRWLIDHPTESDFLLYRYLQALRGLAKANEKYFREMDYGANGYEVPEYGDERAYLLFLALVRGYEQHLAILSRDDRAASVDAFGMAIGNAALAKKLFTNGVSQAV
jgi:hypothetical protein